jgi:hypothetical protein
MDEKIKIMFKVNNIINDLQCKYCTEDKFGETYHWDDEDNAMEFFDDIHDILTELINNNG